MVTILLAVYNAEKYITEQLDSLFNQTYQDFHLMIRDNQSIDQTLAIIEIFSKRYPDRITVIRSPLHTGPMENFSALLNLVPSDYLFFCDADDVWLPKKIELSLEKIKKLEALHGKQTPCLVHGDLQVVDQNLNLISLSFWKYAGLNPAEGTGKLVALMAQNTITGNTVCINQALAKMARPIPPEAIMHDWWIGLIAGAFGVIGKIEEPMILYRQHTQNSLGAQKYTLFNLSIKKRRAMFWRLDGQARCFLERYKTQMSSESLEQVNRWLSFIHAPLWKRIQMVSEYGFYKQGLLRNLGELLASFKKP